MNTRYHVGKKVQAVMRPGLHEAVCAAALIRTIRDNMGVASQALPFLSG
ncbi:hypothetical protein G3578_12445 [Brevibacillus sp. SYP-B805]|nr:hypothetical protein [Brevibacillus sp. SYP-B805]NGQ95967.1 hypothetical protein [Brevibacillus sp. SYP-B805]